MNLGRQDIVHFIVEQVSPLFTHGDELSYLIVFFFKSQTHAYSPFNLPIGALIAMLQCKMAGSRHPGALRN